MIAYTNLANSSQILKIRIFFWLFLLKSVSFLHKISLTGAEEGTSIPYEQKV